MLKSHNVKNKKQLSNVVGAGRGGAVIFKHLHFLYIWF